MNLVPYLGYFRTLKNRVRDAVTEWWDATKHSGSSSPEDRNFRNVVQQKLDRIKAETVQRIDALSGSGPSDFSHIYRRKTRMEMIKISAAVCGIEFAYAAETAFVSPLLLNLGLRHRHLTLMWFLSPLLGFFITPVLGSLSDGCRSKLGRRRPFIILLSIGIILGLILVPNGKQIGIWLGDTYKTTRTSTKLDSNQSQLTNNSDEAMAHIVPKREDWETTILTRNLSSIPVNTTRVLDLLPNLDESIHFQQLRYSAMKSKNATMRGQLSSNSNSINRATESSIPQPHDFPYYTKPVTPKALGTRIRIQERDPLLAKEANASETRYFNQYRAKHKGPRKANNQKVQTLFHDILTEWEHEFVDKSPLHANIDLRHEHAQGDMGASNGNKSEGNGNGNGSETFDEWNKNTSIVNGETVEEYEGAWSHSWGIFFTVMGTVLLDFDADACQSPSRAFMLDVTVPEDQARGLSTFTVISGIGGSIGYLMGSVDWERTFIGNFFGGQVRAVFTLILFIFIACVYVTITSFCELPADALNSVQLIGSNHTTDGQKIRRTDNTRSSKQYSRFRDEEDSDEADISAPDSSATPTPQIGQQDETSFSQPNVTKFEEDHDHELPPAVVYSPTTHRRSISTISSRVSIAVAANSAKLPTFKDYVKTIVKLPVSLRWLCLTNFFSWLSLVCYSLYFTDFVGESVFHGNPNALLGSKARNLYQDGVRFGCFGMSLYALSCSMYSLVIERFVYKFGAQKAYIAGHVVYSFGMICMALTCTRAAVIIFSWTSGILYATLFTMPYLLVARYHAAEIFDVSSVGSPSSAPAQQRGLGTDVAIVSSMVFLAQMTQSLILGTIVTLAGTTVAIIFSAAVFSLCGALAATKVLYLDL